jgi:hypothetical protein
MNLYQPAYNFIIVAWLAYDPPVAKANGQPFPKERFLSRCLLFQTYSGP